MRIKDVVGSCLMGASFKWEPEALNFVFGRNDTGKTRLAVAIKLAILNMPPAEVDNTPREIYQRLASGPRLEVAVGFDGGQSIHREWWMDDEIVKHKSHVPRELDGATPLVMLDAAAYFTLSARKRVEMVFAVAKLGEDVKWERFTDILAEKAGETVRVTQSERVTVQEWLENALTAVERERSAAAADVKRHTGTMQTFAQLQLEERPATRSVAAIDKDIGTVQSERAMKLARDVTLNAEEEKDRDEVEPQRIELRACIKDAGDPPAKELDFEQLRRDQGRLQNELRVAKEQKETHDDWVLEEDRRLDRISRLVDDIKDQKSEVARIPGIEKKIQKLEAKAKKKCATCKQLIVVAADAESLATHRSNIVELRNIKEQLDKDVAEHKRLTGAQKPEPSQPRSPDAIQADLTAVEEQIAEFTATGQVKLWRQELESLGEKPDHTAERARIKTEVDALDARETALKEERRTADSDAHDRKRMAEARVAQDAAVAKETRFKDAKAWLLEKKGELVVQVFGPLLETTERFLRGIFPQKLEYVDGEIGMRVRGTWVTEATFGGARRAIVHAALQVALGVNSPCRIVVMDELWRLDSVNIRPLLHNVQQAHEAGLLDQFVGIQPEKIAKVKGFTFFEATGEDYERR